MIPPIGEYWKKRSVPIKDFEHMRRGQTKDFDNAHQSITGAWDVYKNLIKPECLHLIEDSGVGDPPLHKVHSDYGPASVGSIEYAAMFSLLLPEFRPEGACVLEIGGGYGGLAVAGMTMGANVWEIVDIPNTRDAQDYYLDQHTFNGTAQTMSPEEYDNDWVRYDLVIQTRGFMEMSKEEIQFYFDRIQHRAEPGDKFLTINRRFKISNFCDYPFDKKWKVLKTGDWTSFPYIYAERTDVDLPDAEEALRVWR